MTLLAALVILAATPPETVDVQLHCALETSHLASDVVLAAVMSDHKDTDPVVITTMTGLRTAIETCGAKYHWSDEKKKMAGRYMAAQAERDVAPAKLGEYGLSLRFIDDYVSALDEPARQRFVTNTNTTDDRTRLLGAIIHAVPRFDALTDPQAEKMGEAIGEAVVATILAQKISREFGGTA